MCAHTYKKKTQTILLCIPLSPRSHHNHSSILLACKLHAKMCHTSLILNLATRICRTWDRTTTRETHQGHSLHTYVCVTGEGSWRAILRDQTNLLQPGGSYYVYLITPRIIWEQNNGSYVDDVLAKNTTRVTCLKYELTVRPPSSMLVSLYQLNARLVLRNDPPGGCQKLAPDLDIRFELATGFLHR